MDAPIPAQLLQLSSRPLASQGNPEARDKGPPAPYVGQASDHVGENDPEADSGAFLAGPMESHEPSSGVPEALAVTQAPVLVPTDELVQSDPG